MVQGEPTTLPAMKSNEGEQAGSPGCHVTWLEQIWTRPKTCQSGTVLPSVMQLTSLLAQGEGAEVLFQKVVNGPTILDVQGAMGNGGTVSQLLPLLL